MSKDKPEVFCDVDGAKFVLRIAPESAPEPCELCAAQMLSSLCFKLGMECTEEISRYWEGIKEN